MAIACGLAVANLYYAQPLLDTLSQSFDIASSTAGLIVTMTQMGYVLGLAFIVPLGDLLERRRLITIVTLGTVGALVLAGLSPTIGLFLFASLMTGLTSVVAQILVPFAAHQAREGQRGTVVGRVMSGLLIGILVARALSGIIADALGWRALFWLAAGFMFVQALVLWYMLPDNQSELNTSYGKLLHSVLHLFLEEPLLRRRIVYGTLGFAAFSVFWTAMSFLLAHPPYHYSDTIIGLLGLLGAGGALCAAFAGKIHDRGGTFMGTGIFLAFIALSFVFMGIFKDQLAAIIAGVILLDVGQQGTHVLNQSVIYELRPDARSRITTAYMTCFFFGGVMGSAGSAYVNDLFGWTGVCILGGAFGGIAFLFWLTERLEL